jgi:hypothetical protein
MKEALEQLERKVETEGVTDANLKAFWRLVTQAKLQKQMSDDEFKRIIELRDKLFEKKYPRFLSLWQGLTLTAISVIIGGFLVWYALQSSNMFFFLVASFLILTGTHPWGHWIAGKLVRVNYEYFFLNGPARFEPCLKIDYRDYLKASFDSRIIVHGSGALATVLTALTLLMASFSVDSFEIRSLGVLVFAVVIMTEVFALFGFASGDLKRVRRERKLKRLYNKRKWHQ